MIARRAMGGGGGGGPFGDDENDDDDAKAAAMLAAQVPPRDARLIGALIQVGLTGSLAVLLGAVTGTEPVARLWSGLTGFQGGDAAAATAAAALAAGSSSPLATAASLAAPYFLPLLAVDVLLFAVPWSMPAELRTVSAGGRRCVDARAIAAAAGDGGGDDEGGNGKAAAAAMVSLPMLVQAGLALHRNVALLPPRLATVAFADGPDDSDDDEEEDKAKKSRPQTREERLAALGLAPLPSAKQQEDDANATNNNNKDNVPLDDAAALSLPAEAALVAARELSKELLQRGVLLVFTARWLSDRLGEAGAGGVAFDDPLSPLALPATAVGASLAASLLTASIVPAAAGEAASVRAAAAAALVASSKDVVEAAEASGERGSRRKGGRGGGGDGGGAEQEEEKEEDKEDDDDSSPSATTNLLLDYRLLEATELALASFPPAIAGGVTLARVIALAAAANACFVDSGGNLAATLVGAVAINEAFGLGYRGWAKAQAEAEQQEQKGRRRRAAAAEAAARGG
jgi:hypothetical protein